MDEEHFIKQNSSIWQELEEFSVTINKKGIKSLPSKDIKRFLYIFRLCSHHLAYARTYYTNSKVTEYLNSLIGKCHSHVYGVKKVSFGEFIKYITFGFPKLCKEYKVFILASFGFFLLGALISLIFVAYNPNNAAMFLPKSMIEGVKGGQAGSSSAAWNYPLESSQIMVNNISVSLRAFVYGITLGIGTIYVLFQNGVILGSLTALIYSYGNPINYWSLILPHGVFELTAIFISGAAGLIIAKGMLLPGEHSRIHSTVDSAKKAVSLMLGVVMLLVIAAIIEGFFTPLKINPYFKLLFAAVTAVILLVYFSIPYIIKNKS